MLKNSTGRFLLLFIFSIGGLVAADGPQPGLTIRITAAEIAADGTISVRYRLSDAAGTRLDRTGAETPGTVSTSFICATIPKGATQYVSYTTRTQTSPITSVAAIQAAGENNGEFRALGNGEYLYIFRTKAPEGFDPTATHSIGAYGSRNLSQFSLGSHYDDDVFTFVPDGSRVQTVRDVIRTATCNKCHHQLAFHGGSRRTMELCVLCHTPQTTDPDTGNSVDMPVMTHKIHMGASLPSVRAGKKYQIIGNQQSVHDYSEVVFPADARRCGTCHEAGAAQSGNLFKANRAACGACHDDVNFRSGEGHLDLPQFSDNQCATCHTQRGELEFDASILGAHTVPRESRDLPGVVFGILEVADGVVAKRPTVTFTIKDRSGRQILPSEMSRLNLILAGPTSDYTTYVSEDARRAEGPSGRYYWTFQAPIPADARGSFAVLIDGRREIKLLAGTKKEVTARDTGRNQAFYFSVDGSPREPRRTAAAIEKCNACHASLAFHGENRNRIESCVVCHNPTRTAGSGAAAVSIDFRWMVHKIHRGNQLTKPYTIGTHVYQKVGYPGDLSRCSACHVEGANELPLPSNRMAVTNPNGVMNPVRPMTAACTACHDSDSALAHATENTSEAGERCGTCHGKEGEQAVSRVHAR